MTKSKFPLAVFIFLSFNSAKATSLQSQAQTLADAALREARENGRCVAVAIVDKGGALLHFTRDECAYLGSVETSIQKAKSANAFRRPTSAFEKSLGEGRLGIVTANGVVALAGGVPITNSDDRFGAIGIGGATAAEDEAIAVSALKSLENRIKK